MTQFRYVLALALASSLMAAGSAAGSSAPPKLDLPDAANDANAINGQGFVVGSEEGVPFSFDGNVTPIGSQPDKDFTNVQVAPTATKKRGKWVCTGFRATITLSGPPGANTIWRITGATKKNPRLFWLAYNGSATTLRFGHDTSATGTTTTHNLKKPALITGNTITFIVDESDLKVASETPSELSWSGLGAETRTVTPAATVPVWDQVIVDEKKTFTLC